MSKETEKEALIHTIFMMVKTNTAWLKLKPVDRFAFIDRELRPILKKYPSVTMRFFDSEAFNGKYTDVLLWETSDLRSYSSVCDELRETDFWGHYFEIVDIVPSIENSYAAHYNVPKFSTG